MNLDLGTLVKLGHACPACQTGELRGSTFDVDAEAASNGVRTLTATKCDSCGDVRLYALCSDPDDTLQVRGQLDLIAAVLSDAAAEKFRDELH